MIDGSPSFSDPALQAQISHIEEWPPHEGKFATPKARMHAELTGKLDSLGMTSLYLHQAEAYDRAARGEDIVVVTGTNSGKTLCYNLPVVQMCITEPVGRAMYLFPTKALAQDQQGKLAELAPKHVEIGTYDGDTPPPERSRLRRSAQIILTNPDMLHVGILPGHENWIKFLKNLRYIVLDEMHVYRGVFGSNVGNVLRRLLRLCEWHRNRPQIIACSATIGNPTELFQKLTGRQASLIDGDGSPSGKRTFVFFNPPEVGEERRLSANIATSEILAQLVETGQRTLAFNRARVSAELVLKHTRARLKSGGEVRPDKVESYRAGYTIKERREIEQALFQGKLLGLSATNAMELGVDVGTLDAVILNGYPGTASSFWQQAGRAGRGTRDAVAIFVAHDDPLEQFLVRNPKMLLEARNERVAANPENEKILARHLVCAAHERPLSPTELTRFGKGALDIAEALDRAGELQFRAGLFFYPGVDSPALGVSIRGSGTEQVTLMLEGRELGSMEFSRALGSAHEGAVYLHRGQSFIVTSLDLALHRADLVAFDGDYYTQSIVQSVVMPQVAMTQTEVDGIGISLSGITVTDTVDGFRRKSLDGDRVLSVEALDLPATTFDTVGVRFDLPPLDPDFDMATQIGAVHGFEHAMLAVAPFLAGCDRGDLGSAWYSVFPDTMRPTVFIFDRAPGGVGLGEKLFELRNAWIHAARQLLVSCACETGCPACLLSSRCESGNEALSKSGAVGLLRRLGG